jgi:hypothetical protein
MLVFNPVSTMRATRIRHVLLSNHLCHRKWARLFWSLQWLHQGNRYPRRRQHPTSTAGWFHRSTGTDSFYRYLLLRRPLWIVRGKEHTELSNCLRVCRITKRRMYHTVQRCPSSWQSIIEKISYFRRRPFSRDEQAGWHIFVRSS